MNTFKTRLSEYSIGADRERHLVPAALLPNQFRFQHGGSDSCHPLQALIVTISPADPWWVSDQATGFSTLNNGAKR